MRAQDRRVYFDGNSVMPCPNCGSKDLTANIEKNIEILIKQTNDWRIDVKQVMK